MGALSSVSSLNVFIYFFKKIYALSYPWGAPIFFNFQGGGGGGKCPLLPPPAGAHATKVFLSKMCFTIDCQVLFYVRSIHVCYISPLRHISITIRVFYQYAVRSYQIACDWSQVIHTCWLHYARQGVQLININLI